jgi:tRNA threonylcarbamoyl adenosine modification protein YeaZ
MLLLALDTAGPDCAAALARPRSEGCEIVAERSEPLGRGHAERLIPMVEELLTGASSSFADVLRIAVTTGPGSFTGIRVGVAAARGLALALAIPAVGVGSLEALAFDAAKERRAGTAVAALDAKRGEVYVLAQDIASGAIVIEAEAMRLESAAARLSEVRAPLILTGSAAPLLARLRSGVEIAGTAASPHIADVAALGFRKTAGEPPVPIYARGADAKPQADKAVARL